MKLEHVCLTTWSQIVSHNHKRKPNLSVEGTETVSSSPEKARQAQTGTTHQQSKTLIDPDQYTPKEEPLQQWHNISDSITVMEQRNKDAIANLTHIYTQFQDCEAWPSG